MSRAGNSCHLCHTGFVELGLFFCSAIKPNGRACRKKLCDRCISRKFPDLYDPELRTAGKWMCPSCLLRCPCANCRVCEHGAVRKRCAVLTCIHHPSYEGKEFTRRRSNVRKAIRVSPYRRPQDKNKEEESAPKSSDEDNKCPSCNEPNTATSKFCTECGFHLHVKSPKSKTSSIEKREEREESSIDKLAAAALVVEPVKTAPPSPKLPSPKKESSQRRMSVDDESSTENIDSDKMQDEHEITPELGQGNTARRLPAANAHVLFPSDSRSTGLSPALRNGDVSRAVEAHTWSPMMSPVISPSSTPALVQRVVNPSVASPVLAQSVPTQYRRTSLSYSPLCSVESSPFSSPVLAQRRRLVAVPAFTASSRSPALQARRDSAPTIPIPKNLSLYRRVAQRSMSSPVSSNSRPQQVPEDSIPSSPSFVVASAQRSPFMVVRPIPRKIEEGEGVHWLPQDNEA
eukprot:g32574.t1